MLGQVLSEARGGWCRVPLRMTDSPVVLREGLEIESAPREDGIRARRAAGHKSRQS